MQVIFTNHAKFKLKDIYQYYKTTASLKVAFNIKQDIINKSLSLNKFPLKGQLEENLKDLNEEIRYLVAGHFKIIYYLYQNSVYITDVFDTRQDPSKMGKL